MTQHAVAVGSSEHPTPAMLPLPASQCEPATRANEGAATSSPLVSVCIPTYQGAPYIEAAIRSVLAQTYTNFELIVVDDASPDNTCAVVERIQDPRLRIVRHATNAGAEGNWNRCLAEARGKYVKLFPQDDLLHPDCLTKQVKVLESDAIDAVAFVFCARYIVASDGRVLLRRGFPSTKSRVVDRESLTRMTLRRGGNLVGEPGAVLFRLSSVAKVGVFDASIPYVVDLDYWLRLLAEGSAYYIAEPLASFRVSNISWSVAIGKKQTEQFVRLIERISAGGAVHLSRWDKFVGRTAARCNVLLRLAIYRLVIRKAR